LTAWRRWRAPPDRVVVSRAGRRDAARHRRARARLSCQTLKDGGIVTDRRHARW